MNSEKQNYLNRFPPIAEIVELDTLSQDIMSMLPRYWIDIFSTTDFRLRKNTLVNEWDKYVYQLESTTRFLRSHLDGLDLIQRDGEISMLYTLRNLNGTFVYYEGLNPNKLSLTPRLSAVWEDIPKTVTAFYENLHNGWYHYSSHSTGYLPTKDIFFLDELEWGILDEINFKELPFKLSDCVALFHNGAAGYVCIDLQNRNKENAFIWWKDDLPELEQEVCPLIDEWTVIGLEN